MKWYNKKNRENIKSIPNIPPTLHLTVQKTENVKPYQLEEVKRKLNDKVGEPILITIYPMLVRNLCHTNCMLMLEILNKKTEKYRHIIGYNITSCPCGQLYSFELHSVLQYIPTGEYIDLTADFAGEKEKWFIPIQNYINPPISFIQYLKRNEADLGFNSEKTHWCMNGTRMMEWRPNLSFPCGEEMFCIVQQCIV
jgi:hypothetical protein